MSLPTWSAERPIVQDYRLTLPLSKERQFAKLEVVVGDCLAERWIEVAIIVDGFKTKGKMRIEI